MPDGYANYDVWKDIWPEADKGRVAAPVRVGMDRETGRMLVGWPHVKQSLVTLFMTRYHERVLRYWVGSFVPHLLGENLVESTITRFFWAIATAIDLWEPCYSIEQVHMMTADMTVYEDSQEAAALTSTDMIRRGEVAFQTIGQYRPRGHLGDSTPFDRRSVGIIGRGDGIWTLAPERII